ncbi:MAG: hypothetical protein ACI9F9_000250, partial [Candidatus Paceibacteria bacterium]
MNDILCLSIDAESESGSALAKKYGVRGYPALLFLNSDGSPRDSISGYMPTAPFQAEVQRIKSGEGTVAAFREEIASDADALAPRFKLIKKLANFNAKADIEAQRSEIGRIVESGKGFDAKSVQSVWELYRNLKEVGMTDLAQAQVTTIKRLDPEGKSMPMRRMTFDGLMADLRSPGGLSAVESFLAQETYDEILFDGWYAVYSLHDGAAKKTRKRDEHKVSRHAARAAAIQLWKHAPKKHHARLGNAIAWGFYEDGEDLTETEKAFAVQVAKIAMEASEGDVNVIDTYACCLF